MRHPSVAVLALRQKAAATLVILGMNLLVFLFVPWFVLLTAVPSLLLLWAILRQ